MSISEKYIQYLKNKETKSTRSKLSECNFNHLNDWDKDLIYRWTSNACLECNNQECRLQHILSVENLQSGSRPSYEVKEFVVKSLAGILSNLSLINDALKNETTAFFEKAFHGCNWIMANIEMQTHFKSNIKDLAVFVKLFLEFEAHVFKTSNPVIKEMAKNSLSSVIDSYLEIYKQFSNKELFAIAFLNDILFPICNLTKFDKVDNSKINSELYRCVQILLFTEVLLPQYKKFSNQNEGIPATLFSMLKKIANIDLEAGFMIFEVIFHVAIKSYKSDTKVIDLIFRNIIQSSNREKQIIKKLLDCLIGINLNMDNEIGDVKLSDYLINFIEEILKQEHLDSLDYDLITGIINIHHYTIETNMENILIKLLPKQLNVSETSYSAFFAKILEVSIYLRQVHKLISLLLMATKSITSGNPEAEILIALPEEFLTKFMESVSNITVSQTTIILRSFIFHLKFYSEDSLSNCSNSSFLMLEIILRLLIPFMKGIKIFDCIRNVITQQKVCDDLVELGNRFFSISNTILKIDCNKSVILRFAKACQAWNDVCNLILHYAPSLASDKLTNLFSTKKWIKLLAKVQSLAEGNLENIDLEFSQSLFINLIDEEKVIETINCRSPFWISVTQNHAGLISNLSDQQLSEMADIVVSNSNKDSSDDFEKWNKSKNNVRFVSALVNEMIKKSENSIKSEATKQLIGKIIQDFKWKKVISKIKKGSLMGKDSEFSKNNKSKDSKVIKEFFNLLSSVHLSHLHHDIRIVLFIVISSISSEFSHDIQISEKCNEILLDLLQENDINIFQFPNLQVLLQTPLEKDVLSHIFELPLKNDSFNSLINFLDSNEISDNIMSTLLNIVQKIKLHRNSEENQSLKNLIDKWNNLSIKDDRIRSTIELVILVFSLKDAVISRNVSEELKETTNRILHEIFQSFDKESKFNEEYLPLLKLVLINRSFLGITNENINLISKAILCNPNEFVLRSFLETLNSEEFNVLLKSLQIQTMNALGEDSANEFKKCLLIWEHIVIIEMASVRSNSRLAAINNLLYTLDKTSISEKHWLCLLKLFGTIVSSKFIQITGQIIDLILLSCMKCMKRVGVIAFGEIVTLYTMIVKLRSNFVKDKLSLLVLLNREIIRSLSDKTTKLNDVNDQYQLECLILDVDKFVIALKKLGENVSEMYLYMLNDLVECHCHHLLLDKFKNPLEIIIQRLLSHCEYETTAFLSRTMPAANKKIFIELDTKYRKHYKFTGKI